MRRERGDAASLQRGVRQLLADGICGTRVGLWLLIPEFLRLGVWDLLCGWSRRGGAQVEPRLALQSVNEAALCVSGVRALRCISQKGFEVANGLPFVASDEEIHRLFASHSVGESTELQVALGRLRRAAGHFQGQVLALDPHRMPSSSKRQMPRHRPKPQAPAVKTSQAFFCLDVDTAQPLCCYLGSSALSAAQASAQLLQMCGRILNPHTHRPLVLADSEHFSAEQFLHVRHHSPFDLLTPMPAHGFFRQQIEQLAPQSFTHRWAGYATASTPFSFSHHPGEIFTRFVQRSGETPDTFHHKAFLCTSARDELQALARHYPQRWHVETFFNLEQHLGWKRAGTLNLNIRYGRMSMALIAQAAVHQLRRRLPPPLNSWSAQQLSRNLLCSLDGDIRVRGDTIIVTYYNADQLGIPTHQFTRNPERLAHQGHNPRVPWLYDFKVDFRFR